jgi:hypothetical protein
MSELIESLDMTKDDNHNPHKPTDDDDDGFHNSTTLPSACTYLFIFEEGFSLFIQFFNPGMKCRFIHQEGGRIDGRGIVGSRGRRRRRSRPISHIKGSSLGFDRDIVRQIMRILLGRTIIVQPLFLLLWEGLLLRNIIVIVVGTGRRHGRHTHPHGVLLIGRS